MSFTVISGLIHFHFSERATRLFLWPPSPYTWRRVICWTRFYTSIRWYHTHWNFKGWTEKCCNSLYDKKVLQRFAVHSNVCV